MTITGLGKREHAQALAAGDLETLASAGGPRTGVEVRIVDADDREVSEGEIGEIVTRSDCVMQGYWMDLLRARPHCAAAGCTLAISAARTRAASSRSRTAQRT